MRNACVVMLALGLAACSRPEPVSTPLPTKQGTIGRVNQGLEKADEDAAKRRAETERAAAGGDTGEDKPTKSISAGY
jgi:putative hemolysin